MKIALAQLNYTTGDIQGNASKIVDAVEKAKAVHADLVVFAEQAVSGTPAFDLLRKTTFIELCDEALENIASHCKGIAAIVGLPILTNDGTISAAAVVVDGRVVRCVGKQFISARREMGYLVPSKGYEYVEMCGHKMAVVVGDDLSHIYDMDREADMIVSINSRRYGKDVLAYRYDSFRKTAFVEGKTLVFINNIGGSAEIVYDGTSCVVDKSGEITLMMKSFEEDFAVYDTDAEHKAVETMPYSTCNDHTRMLYRAACLGLKDYFAKSGYTKASIGLSGGIDSAVVACIAADALGRENVKALLMPSQFSSDHSVEDAKALAENLGIQYSVLPITEVYKSIMDTLKPITGGTEFDSTEENIQSRIRTIMLMAMQNKSGYVLLNSSNKSENALGFCTLYGDTAGAFSVTGDLYKTEMYAVARYINREFNDVIPENILTKEPSSELHPNQKDSDILPPYDVVDAILERMIEEGQHREEIVNAGFDSEVVEKIHSMIMRNEKKRYQFPPVLRLSSCAFKHERLMPLINKYGY
ncbi:MAG TPA: NAD+ synthase [Candidatus Alistipes excrementipullorum]|nr:NAD+ synthase [Candidatus Alistipes excrementipullorum]